MLLFKCKKNPRLRSIQSTNLQMRQSCEKLSGCRLKQSDLKIKVENEANTPPAARAMPHVTFSLIPGQRCNPVSTFFSHCKGGGGKR
jgi:hypothetical protein